MADIIQSLTDFSRLRSGIAAVAAQAGRGSRIMWMLGPFMFSRDTAAPVSLRRTSDYSWPSQERFSAPPALQYTGPGDDVIDLDGVIYPHYVGGLAQIQAMRELAALGLPQLLVDGRGMVYGKWAILHVEETGTVFMDNGAPRKIAFTVSLQRYYDDSAGDVKKKLGILKW